MKKKEKEKEEEEKKKKKNGDKRLILIGIIYLISIRIVSQLLSRSSKKKVRWCGAGTRLVDMAVKPRTNYNTSKMRLVLTSILAVMHRRETEEDWWTWRWKFT